MRKKDMIEAMDILCNELSKQREEIQQLKLMLIKSNSAVIDIRKRIEQPNEGKFEKIKFGFQPEES